MTAEELFPEIPKEAARDRGIRERRLLAERLTAEGETDLAEKLDNCGLPMKLVCVCCGNPKTVEVRCRRRWCPACAWLVQRERIDRYETVAAGMKWPLFITLTKPNSSDPECIRTIRADWGRMKRRKLMQDRITGGISTIEVTNNGNGWHPHLHILADCRWLAIHTPEPRWNDSDGVKRQKYDHARLELSAIWATVIKNPVAVVLATRKPAGDALKYCLKYAVKGSDLIECPDPIGPLIRVLSRSRMMSTFGDVHGRVAADDEEEKPAVVCTECGNEKSFMPEEALRFVQDPINRLPSMPRRKPKHAAC